MSGYKALPLALLLSACGTTQNATTSSIDPTPHRGTLCSLLERIEPGEVLPVVVSGVYQVAYEAQVLADPTRPPCQRDVQPVTWVELAPNAEGKQALTPSRFSTSLSGESAVIERNVLSSSFPIE
jgi:hypothetical protein